MAKFILPYNILSHYVTAPGGGTEDCIPQTPCVAPLRSIRSTFIFIYQNQRILCSFAI